MENERENEGEDVNLGDNTVVIDVEEARAGLVVAGDHRADGKAHAAVLVEHVREELARSSHRDGRPVAERVQAAVAAEVALPEQAICCTACHRAHQTRVDLDDLLHRGGSCEDKTAEDNELLYSTRYVIDIIQ